MAGDSNRSTGTQTTQTSMPGYNQVLGTAGNLFNSGLPWAPNTTSMVSPFSTQTKAGLTGMYGQAADPTTRWNLAANFNRQANTLNSLGSNGLTGLQDAQVNRLEGVAGGNGMNAEQQSAYNLLNPIAQGSMMQGNPYLDEVINRTSQDIGNSSNMMASAAGRYGSGSHQGVLNDAIGDMSAKLRYQNYGDEANRRDAAIRDVFGMGSTGQGQRMDAIGSLYNAGQQGLQNIQGGTQALQDAYQAKLSPYQTMLGVGNAYENKNNQVLQDQARVFQEKKNALTDPVNWLANLSGAFRGGTQVQQGYQPYSPIGSGIGGFLSGYGATGSPWLGALGGLGSVF